MIIEKECRFCKKVFKTRQYEKRERQFCSQKCYRLWRKEFYVPSDESKIKTSNALKGRPATGKPFEKGHKINKGRKPWNTGLVLKDYFDEELYNRFVEMCRQNAVSTYIKVTTPGHRTKIEIKIEEFLKEIGVKYLSQYAMLGISVPDFYLPDYRLVIYADGNYWHNYPHGNKRDHYIKKELERCNYNVLRFWESDINENFEEVKNSILSKLSKQGSTTIISDPERVKG